LIAGKHGRAIAFNRRPHLKDLAEVIRVEIPDGYLAPKKQSANIALECPSDCVNFDAGYEWARYGENIARGQQSAAEVVTGWMNSPAHRENIMDCRLRQMGIGLAFDGGEQPYWVQDFATPQ
jgi:hypothetical protein